MGTWARRPTAPATPPVNRGPVDPHGPHPTGLMGTWARRPTAPATPPGTGARWTHTSHTRRASWVRGPAGPRLRHREQGPGRPTRATPDGPHGYVGPQAHGSPPGTGTRWTTRATPDGPHGYVGPQAHGSSHATGNRGPVDPHEPHPTGLMGTWARRPTAPATPPGTGARSDPHEPHPTGLTGTWARRPTAPATPPGTGARWTHTSHTRRASWVRGPAGPRLRHATGEQGPGGPTRATPDGPHGYVGPQAHGSDATGEQGPGRPTRATPDGPHGYVGPQAHGSTTPPGTGARWTHTSHTRRATPKLGVGGRLRPGGKGLAEPDLGGPRRTPRSAEEGRGQVAGPATNDGACGAQAPTRPTHPSASAETGTPCWRATPGAWD